MTVCGLGPQAFLNCAGFIKIDTAAISDTTTNYIEVLDGSRVHPETYEWAKKMAVDALEYDEVMKFVSSGPLCVTQRWGERVQGRLSAHAHAKPIRADQSAGCRFHPTEKYLWRDKFP